MRLLSIMICLLVPAIGYAEEEPKTIKQNWNKHCKKCHGAEGIATKIGLRLGSPENIYESSQHATAEEIFNVINEGENKMPSFKKKLTEDEIRELAAHIEYSCLINKVMGKKEKIEKELDSIRRNYKSLPECEQ